MAAAPSKRLERAPISGALLLLVGGLFAAA
jgi:hypothetical protein